MNFGDASLGESFWTKVQPCPMSGCWIWSGAVQRDGYGSFRLGGRKGGVFLSHRVSYTALRGDIPAGLDLDHLCRVRCCVNPAHLEAVTHRENCRRGNAGEINRLKTHCPVGHEYSDGNTGPGSDGRRVCKACGRVRALARYHRTKVLTSRKGRASP